MIELRAATMGDLLKFIKEAREADKEEVIKSSGLSLDRQLMELWKEDPIAIWEGEDLIGIGGYKEDKNDGVLGWILLTKNVNNHKISFLRWSKRYINDLLKTYKRIYNSVYVLNKWHIDYLKWLGASFVPCESNKEFMWFTIERR